MALDRGMLQVPMSEDTPSPPPESPLPEQTAGLLKSFFGLFLVPLLVVLVCVGVFIGFGWIAYDRQTTADYLHDLRSSWRPRRAQAAYELSKILIADPLALEGDPGAKAEVRALFEEAEDEETRRYLALVLGHTRDPEAVPLLVDTLDSADSELRIYALMALGTVGDPMAVSPLVGALADADSGIRKIAAFSLGELGAPEAIPALQLPLQDPVADVRWNAALALARLGSDAGVPVLEQMLDRQLTEQEPGITPAQVEETMIGAVRALAVVRGAESRSLLDRLAKEDPSLKVRQAAIEAVRALD